MKNLKNRLVLIVDDDQDSAIKLKEIFEKNGLRTILAKDGREALSMIKSNKPDFIATDLNMPIMDGYEMTREIRRTDEDTPIFMFTSQTYPPSDLEEIMKRIGVNRFISSTNLKEMFYEVMEQLDNAFERNHQAAEKMKSIHF
jgi:two-component system, response regulator, stage 0 sporulation protein F